MTSQEFYYAIYKGRIDKPAIYCSWSQVHPRVTEYKGADHEKFETVEKARIGMSQRGIKDFDLVIRDPVRKPPMSISRERCWAVAGGKSTGIFTTWRTAKTEIDGTKACHRAFDSREEAEDFIRSWKDAFADVSRWAIRQALENGWQPRDMNFDVASFLIRDKETRERREDKQIRLQRIERGENIDLPMIEKLAIKEEGADNEE